MRPNRKLFAPVLGLALVLVLTACEPEQPRYSVVALGQDAEAAIARSENRSVEEIIRNQFGPAADQAMRIVRCESNFDPNAVSPTNDHGLFQINRVHRNTFPQVTGQPWGSVYDPYWNTVYAKYLYDREGWRPWTCRKVL